MAHIPKTAQPWLAAVSEHLKAFEEDHSMGFSLLELAGDMRNLSDAAARAAEALRDAYLAERRGA